MEAEPVQAKPTILERQLRGGAPQARPTALDALRLARATFLAGRRVDITALAAELGVSRVTLHRWVGSREQLLSEALWSLARDTLDRQAALSSATGGRRVAEVVSGFVDDLITNPGMRRFLDEEGEFAMRLLTRSDGGLQPRLIAAIARLLDEAVETGGFRLRMDVQELALALVRIAETYVHRRRITGEEPEPGAAAPLLHLVLD